MDTEQLAPTEPHDQLVVVDAGDLEEAMQSATAWAGYLRQRASDRLRGPEASRDAEGSANDSRTADRIDQATHRLRGSSHASLIAKANGGRVRLVYGPLTEGKDGE